MDFKSDSKEDAKVVLARQEELEALRQPFHGVWESIAELVAPAWLGFNSNDIAVQNRLEYGELTTDTTARRAAFIWAAGLQNGTCSAYQRWQKQVFVDEALNEIPEAKAWLQAYEDSLYEDLFRFGYYRAQFHGFLMGGLFGWHTLALEEPIAAGPIVIRSMPLPEMYIDQNNFGQIDTHHRKFRLNSRQAVQEFGYDNLPNSIQTAYTNHNYKDKYEFIRAVFPAKDRNSARLDRNNLPIASMTVSLDARQVIKESGYHESPYLTTRSFHIPSTPYGYSPGTEALADIKMINEMKRLLLEAGQLQVAPPYLAPFDGFAGTVTYDPWTVNYYKADGQFTAKDFAPMGVGNDPRFAWELLQATRGDINDAFMVNFFLSVTQRADKGQVPTATEVNEIAGERNFLLSPILINQQIDGFQALFNRLFEMKMRRGEIPPLPPGLEGQEFKAVYTSPLVLGQRAQQTDEMLRMYADIGLIAPIAPEVLDNIDHDEAVRRMLNQRGFPQIAIRTEEDRDEIRNNRAEAQAEASQAQTLMEAAKVIPPGKAIEAGSPLDKLSAQGMQQ